MVTFEDVEKFVREYEAITKPLAMNDRLEEDLGVTGDDYFELIHDFSKRFEVNIASFHWYFHCHEEPTFNPGALFFPPPSHRVKRISITVGHLVAFAQSKEWKVAYPAHELPTRRYDIVLTSLFFPGVLLVLWLTTILHDKCAK